MKAYIGLDVHRKQTTYVLQDEAGEVIRQGQVPTTPEGLGTLLGPDGLPPLTPVGLETGRQTFWVVGVLGELGLSPVVIDAREVRAKARRVGQKSDSRDAFEIADGVRRGIYTSIVYVPPAGIQRLREILSRRRHFVKICTMSINTTRFLLAARGLPTQSGTLHSEIGWQRLLSRSDVADVRSYVEMHHETWRFAQERVSVLEREIARAMEPFSDVEALLRTVPAIGAITAAAFVAAVGDPERFADSGHLASYLGLVPSTWDSGERTAHGHITHRGNSLLRSLLCEVAHHAAAPRHPLQPYFARICARHGYRRAVVAVAHRLARIVFQVWKHREAFDVSKLNVEHKKTVRKKTVHFRLKTPAEARPAG
jgi:transposase